MRVSASIASVLASVVAFAVAALLAGACSAQDQPIKWRAHPLLEIDRSSTNCGFQYREPVSLEFDGKVLKTSAWSRQTYDILLASPLAADGSGQVYAVSEPLNQSMVLKFEPGHGPRKITYWHRYNARCIWSFEPL
jgi:hypothetical protein